MAETKLTEKDMQKIEKETGAALKKETKVRIKIPTDKLNEKDHSPVPVTINGYRYEIKRGETVDVPETVAKVLERAGYI